MKKKGNGMRKTIEIVKKICIFLFLFLTSLAICMRSELNPISQRVPSIDSDVYIYIGKELNNGKIIYKDIFDHKGPLFHFIEYMGIKISWYKYLGVWILELVCMTVTIIFLYKTCKLITKKRTLSLIAIFVAVVPFSLFFINGNYPEEYSLIFIAIGLYYMVKAIEKDAKLKKQEAFIIGFTLACVILIKMNLISVWIIYLLMLFIKIIKNRDWKQLKESILFFFTGLMLPIIVAIIVMLIQRNLTECIKDYILFNFKYATDGEGNFINTIKMFCNTTYIICIISCVIDFIYKLIVKNRNIMQPISGFIYLIMCMAIIIMPKNEYKHYGMILLTTYVVPLSLLLRNITIMVKPDKNIYRKLILTAILFYCILNLTRRDIVIYKKELLMTNAKRFSIYETRISKYVKENTNIDDNILVLGNECNIYLMAERFSNCKYVYQIPIVNIDSNIMEETIREIKDNRPKLIVLKLTNYITVQEKFYEFLEEDNKYEKINEINNYEIYKIKE